MAVPSADEVRAARVAAELTQAQAAELVGMAHAMRWSEVERGLVGLHAGLWELFQIKTGTHPEYRPRKAARTA